MPHASCLMPHASCLMPLVGEGVKYNEYALQWDKCQDKTNITNIKIVFEKTILIFVICTFSNCLGNNNLTIIKIIVIGRNIEAVFES